MIGTDKKIYVSSSGWLSFENKYFKCVIGRGGLTDSKIEGDGSTPIGIFELRNGLYRADRISMPKAKLEFKKIMRDDGWCDDPSDSKYNKKVKMPYDARCERLWREDSLYDLVVIIGYNDKPVIANKGSAIFLHVAPENYAPTQGCVAISLKNLIELLENITQKTKLSIKSY